MSEREEYTAETYPSFGKKYNGEKAIISLTSWKARINTVSKTLFSLMQQCPGFHIVLVLSEKEFPNMIDELPDNLKLLIDNEMIEILWVYKNYKAFKKVLFTMDKYKNVPIISADDDCIYICNYAQELYDIWYKNKSSCIVRYTIRQSYNTQGPCSLYYINSNDIAFLLNYIKKKKVNLCLDDDFYSKNFKSLKYKMLNTGKRKLPFIFHDVIKPITKNQKLDPAYRGCF